MVIEIVHKKYLSKDGYEYETYEEAENADRSYDMARRAIEAAKEIKGYRKYAEARLKVKMYPLVIRIGNHFGDEYAVAHSQEGLLKLYKDKGQDIFELYTDYGMFDTEEQQEIATAILESDDMVAIYGLVSDLFHNDGTKEDYIEQISVNHYE